MLEMLKEAGSIVLAILALMVLVAGASAVYFFRGKKVERLGAEEKDAKMRIKQAEERGDGAAIKEEILKRVKEARRGGK